jgi:monomeric isocitrate dehydrogenase
MYWAEALAAQDKEQIFKAIFTPIAAELLAMKQVSIPNLCIQGQPQY